MNLGLLLNRKNELPIPIANLLTALMHEIDIKIFNVSHLFESLDCSCDSVMFGPLAKLESLLTRTGIRCQPFDGEYAAANAIHDMDTILCWGTECEKTSECSTRMVSVYLNGERLDKAATGLMEVVHQESFELSIRCDYEGRLIKIASMCCKTYHPLAKTRANALNNACILLKKVIKGEIYQPEEIARTASKRPRKESPLLLLYIMYKAIKAITTFKMRPAWTWSWDIFIGESSSIKELGQIGGITDIIEHDRDRFWADPFVYNHQGVNHIFFEELVYKNKKGNISVLKQETDGSYSYLGVVMDFEYHLSYPFIFEIDGTVYMIPETGSIKSIDLYRCTDFPLRWEFCRTLLHGFKFVDTTVFYYRDRFWLFTSAFKDGVDIDSQLLLFYCDDIIKDDLIEHPANPIVYGVDRSRMAGSIFPWRDGLVRPAQDCSKTYGGAIRFMLIEDLSEDKYSERQIDQLSPWAVYNGTHTFNRNDDIFVLDARIRYGLSFKALKINL